MSKLGEYLKDTRGEFKHVNWPKKQISILFTGVVIIFSIAVAVFLGAFDLLFAYILKLFI